MDGYGNWQDGEPSNGDAINGGSGSEGNCLQLSSGGAWTNEQCVKERSYIEEIDLDGAQDCEAPGVMAYQNHGYRFEGIPVSWEIANDLATTSTLCGVSGHLATLTSADEHAFVSENIVGEIWVGAYKAVASLESIGNWTWVNDEGLVMRDQWRDRELNNTHSNGGCMSLREDQGTYYWSDLPCSEEHAFLIEYDLEADVSVEGCLRV